MFLTILDYHEHPENETIKILDSDLIYQSPMLGCVITVPKGFNTDLASVPRVPIIYMLWGDRAHREAVLHDYLYRTNSVPCVSISEANRVFYEAMMINDKPWWIRHPMFWGVSLGGSGSYHKRTVDWLG